MTKLMKIGALLAGLMVLVVATPLRQVDGVEFKIVETANNYLIKITDSILANPTDIDGWNYHYRSLSDISGRPYYQYIKLLNCMAKTTYWILKKGAIPFEGVYNPSLYNSNPVAREVAELGEDGVKTLSLPKENAENSYRLLVDLAKLARIEAGIINSNPHIKELFATPLPNAACSPIRKHPPAKIWRILADHFAYNVKQLEIDLVEWRKNYLMIYGKSVKEFANRHRDEVKNSLNRYNPYQ